MYYVLLLNYHLVCFFSILSNFRQLFVKEIHFMGTKYNNGMSFGFVVILSSNEPFKKFIWYISKFSEANMRWLCIWLQVHVNSVCFKFKMYEKQTKQNWRIIILTMLNRNYSGLSGRARFFRNLPESPERLRLSPFYVLSVRLTYLNFNDIDSIVIMHIFWLYFKY